MEQRSVAVIAEYLQKRPRGRVVLVVAIAPGDYVMAIEDARDGRTHVIRGVDDLERWLRSFAAGECRPALCGLCAICCQVHRDRDLEGEISSHCLSCQLELVELVANDSGGRR